MSNLQAVKTLDIQIGDFVEVRRMGGNLAIMVTDILPGGTIAGEDVDGYRWQVSASRVISNLQQ